MLLQRNLVCTGITLGKKLVVRLPMGHQHVNPLALIKSFCVRLGCGSGGTTGEVGTRRLLTRDNGYGTFVQPGGGRFFSGVPHPHLLGVRHRAICRG
jgi:hypothetical protein